MLTPRQIIHAFVWVLRHLRKQLLVPEIAVIEPHVRPDDTIFDVGAHGGSWTVPLSRLVPRGQVMAFEALPYYAGVLQATLKIMGRTNASVVQKAIVDAPREVQIVSTNRAGERLAGTTHVKASGEASNGTESVSGQTLDEALVEAEGRVSFVKMDIEGAELLALKGADKLLRTQRPILYLELYESYCARYGHTVADVFDFLQARGYSGYVTNSTLDLSAVDATTYSGTGDVWFFADKETATN